MDEHDVTAFAASVPDTVKYYLGRTQRLLDRLAREPDPERLLAIRLAPDMFDTAFQFAVAIRFAARALAVPAGQDAPDIPEDATLDDLMAYCERITELCDPLGLDQMAPTVIHRAGEADLEQGVAGYVTCFALPNMLFHLSMAYAGLRHGGMGVGKADFDGFHVYRPATMR
ncbi:DUF1993 family protein [Jannaschia aquimarina]|uniref:DUF1993 domain-containing protein n=1 Tax=Jannaschia aquimarina TaxID=935700 RepID=A0A0D1E9F8_9RHOB|nr:DUF1993 family protein [Jannaschia aquimarina]KIT14269.1 hypothetical protein jaqu_40630 [Jannaschia aquimarina]SNS49633.1 hypothetical protein SAMN05421775_101182 [Jannaschia aquimarina]